MRRKVIVWVVAAAAVLAVGVWLARKVTVPPTADAAMAEHFMGLLQQGDIQDAAAMIAPEYRTDAIPGALQQMAAEFPKATPSRIEVVNWRYFKRVSLKKPKYRSTDFEVQYQFDKNWVDAHFVIERTGDGPPYITTAQFKFLPTSLQNLNRFELFGQPLKSYVFLLCVIYMPIFIIWALVICVRTPMRRRKWLWLLFIAFGLGQFSYNWSTHELGFQLLQGYFLGAGWVRSGLYGPVVMYFCFPVGALVFFFNRERLDLRTQDAEADLTVA